MLIKSVKPSLQFLAKKLNKIKNDKGSITIEFSVVILCFILVMYLVSDFGIEIAKKGRLERLNHSLASMLRERKALYHSNEDITQEEVDQLLLVAQSLFPGTRLTLKVDALYLSPNLINPSNNTLANISQILSFHSGGSECQWEQWSVDISALKGLSPYASSSGRWVPIYRVSACIPNESSLFKRLASTFNDEVLPNITTSSIVISRN
ncbi:hypothetical protein WN53_12470 [Serratia fonticola]|uniref:tight adherence pilus pseudopilin TadF n=1 Tax=Serratia fonticola TaxID=47917 RepID=UPI000629E79C|nr:tight adherence pilus pseudopilin TadF [Serratia fonticola]AKG69860.1 hypothetical protein WN53_12470 [Serratia fonticola]CAI1636046.1 Uncharacterised protein [Serratia fonticola]